MARRKGAKTRPDPALEERVAKINQQLDEALRRVDALREARTRLWFQMFNANDYTQRSIALISNREIYEGSGAWATDDAVEKALLRSA